LHYFFNSSFEKSIKRLDKHRKIGIKKSLDAFIKAMEVKQVPVGFGLKKIRSGLWEIRANISDRIVFRWEKNLIEFVITGSHESVKKFLNHF